MSIKIKDKIDINISGANCRLNMRTGVNRSFNALL